MRHRHTPGQTLSNIPDPQPVSTPTPPEHSEIPSPNLRTEVIRRSSTPALRCIISEATAELHRRGER